MKQKFFIPDLMYNIRCFLRECQICQLHQVGPTPQWQFENTIILTHTSISKLSHGLKYMYRATTGHRLYFLSQMRQQTI